MLAVARQETHHGILYCLEKYAIQWTVKEPIWTQRSAESGATFINDARQELYAAEPLVSAARFVSP